MYKHLAKTVCDQSHVVSLPMHVRPIYWPHAQALNVYPLPDAIILADAHDQVRVVKGRAQQEGGGGARVRTPAHTHPHAHTLTHIKILHSIPTTPFIVPTPPTAQYDIEYEGCRCVNPGPFPVDYSFLVYMPHLSEDRVQMSKVKRASVTDLYGPGMAIRAEIVCRHRVTQGTTLLFPVSFNIPSASVSSCLQFRCGVAGKWWP